MTILAWRRKADPHTDDFVFSFDPKEDITTFELATLIRLGAAGVPMERAFRVRPLDLRDLSEKAGTAFRHLREWPEPARESWPIRRYCPDRKRAA